MRLVIRKKPDDEIRGLEELQQEEQEQRRPHGLMFVDIVPDMSAFHAALDNFSYVRRTTKEEND